MEIVPYFIVFNAAYFTKLSQLKSDSNGDIGVKISVYELRGAYPMSRMASCDS